MKIISKWKDYYDYLQGIYGIDPLYTYDRRDSDGSLLDILDKNRDYLYALHIGHLIISMYVNKEGEIIFKKEFENEDDEIKLSGREYYINKELAFLEKSKRPNKSVIVLAKYGLNFRSKITLYNNIKLEKFILDPDDVYKAILDYLSYLKTLDEKEVPVGNDKVRILSAGFDLKQSFRHRKDEK